MKYYIVEGFRRFLQIIIGCQLFTFPILYSIRTYIYKILFGMGNKCRIGFNVILHREHGCKSGVIKIGNNILLGDNVKIDYSGNVTISDNVWISENVHIHTHSHDINYKIRNLNHNACILSSTFINEGAWLGDSSIVLSSCKYIGKGAVVGAGAVVAKDVPDYTVVGGVPAKTIYVIKNNK